MNAYDFRFPPLRQWTVVLTPSPLTEADVRRIVREEMAREEEWPDDSKTSEAWVEEPPLPTVDEAIKDLLIATMRRCNNRMERVAYSLGVTQKTVYNWRVKYGLGAPTASRAPACALPGESA